MREQRYWRSNLWRSRLVDAKGQARLGRPIGNSPLPGGSFLSFSFGLRLLRLLGDAIVADLAALDRHFSAHPANRTLVDSVLPRPKCSGLTRFAVSPANMMLTKIPSKMTPTVYRSGNVTPLGPRQNTKLRHKLAASALLELKSFIQNANLLFFLKRIGSFFQGRNDDLIFGRDQPFDIRYFGIDLVQTGKHLRGPVGHLYMSNGPRN